MKLLKFKIIESPVGLLKLVVNDQALLAILWDNEKLNRVRSDQMVEDKKDPLILEIERQLQEYFLHHRKEFNLPIEASGTRFNKRFGNC